MTPLTPGAFCASQPIIRHQEPAALPSLPKKLIPGQPLAWTHLLNYLLSPEEICHFSHSTESVATNIVVHVILWALTQGGAKQAPEPFLPGLMPVEKHV